MSYLFFTFSVRIIEALLKKLWGCKLNVIENYIWQILENSNIDVRELQFTCDRSHCCFQTKFKGGNTIQFYEKRLSDVWSQYGDKYGESNVLLIDTSNPTSQFVRDRPNHILIKAYTRQEQYNWLTQVLLLFLKTLHCLKEKCEHIRMFNRTTISL